MTGEVKIGKYMLWHIPLPLPFLIPSTPQGGGGGVPRPSCQLPAAPALGTGFALRTWLALAWHAVRITSYKSRGGLHAYPLATLLVHRYPSASDAFNALSESLHLIEVSCTEST
jgi:hypothetical protein